MITDILTVAMKEIKELPYLRKDKSRTNLFTLIILLTVFGILLPWHVGKEWVQSLLSMLPCVWLPFSLVGTTWWIRSPGNASAIRSKPCSPVAFRIGPSCSVRSWPGSFTVL
jgi:hypothetical protein